MMETRWSDAGFLGSILLMLYGLIYFIVFHISPALFSPLLESGIESVLGTLAGLGGVLFSLGFLTFYIEFEQPSMVIPALFGAFAWGLQSLAQLLLALGLAGGAYWYGWAILVLMLCFVIWGISLLGIRSKLGNRERYGLYTALLFIMNAIGWSSYLGFALLALIGIFSAIIFAPDTPVSIFTPLTRLMSKRRRFFFGRLGALFLAIYSLLTLRWMVNQYWAIPHELAIILNLVSVIAAWLAIFGLAIVFHWYEVRYTNRFAVFATAIGIPCLLLLSLADFTWLMSNLNALTDFTWALGLYIAAGTFWEWSMFPLFLWSLVVAIAFFQGWRSPQSGGYFMHLILFILFLVAGFLWLFSLGYIAWIPAGLLLFILYTLIGTTD